MKPKNILNALNGVDEELVEGAISRKKRPRRALWIGAIAAALALVIALGLFFDPWGGSLGISAQALALAPYPALGRGGTVGRSIQRLSGGAQRIKLRQEQQALAGQAPEPWEALRQITVALLSREGTDNKLCSPLNLYLDLALLAESGEGRTREQILSLLGEDSIEQLRTDAKALWLANYRDDGTGVCVLANSLWLDRSRSYQQETVTRLARDYYASVYRGEMGTSELDQDLQTWLSRQTGGALDEQASGLTTEADTSFLLLSSVAFSADWTKAFSPRETESKRFFGAAEDVEADFMMEHAELGTDCLSFRGDRFSGARKLLKDGSAVWFFLPEAGTGATPEELADDGQLWSMLQDPENTADWEYPDLSLEVPRLELSVQTELTDSLRSLGITDVFDKDLADLSPLTGAQDGTYLARADHAVSLSLGEDGCRASSYTVLDFTKYGYGFTLDRPFLLILTNPQGLPLFCGVVNQP